MISRISSKDTTLTQNGQGRMTPVWQAEERRPKGDRKKRKKPSARAFGQTPRKETETGPPKRSAPPRQKVARQAPKQPKTGASETACLPLSRDGAKRFRRLGRAAGGNLDDESRPDAPLLTGHGSPLDRPDADGPRAEMAPVTGESGPATPGYHKPANVDVNGGHEYFVGERSTRWGQSDTQIKTFPGSTKSARR